MSGDTSTAEVVGDESAGDTPFGPGSIQESKPIVSTSISQKGSILSAVGLIMGTAVGPGILGLPAATMSAGLIPATAVILCAWAYVMASVLLVVELSCAIMAEQGGKQISFSVLARRTLGEKGGLLVAVVYAALNYALLVACIAGLGSLLTSATGNRLSAPVASALVTSVVAAGVQWAPFSILDGANRTLCVIMVSSSALLVALGLPHVNMNAALAHSQWTAAAMVPAVPITVLTLGFHVITPLICGLLGGDARRARLAVLAGGLVPLVMVLGWNTVIIGIMGQPAGGPGAGSLDPISLLLSLGTAAAPCVQTFALAALGTTLIGYAMSFPQQLADTLDMLGPNKRALDGRGASPNRVRSSVLWWAIGPPLGLAVFCPTVFARALDFAGLYANCFLFGVLPPLMAWIMRGEKGGLEKLDIQVGGGKPVLLILFCTAIFLGCRPPP